MIVTLYKDTTPIEVDYRDAGHSYTVTGLKKTGVTTITGLLAKPELLPWAAYMAAEAFKVAIMPWATSERKMTKTELKKVSDEAKNAHNRKSGYGKDVGTIVHAWIKEEIAGGLVAVSRPEFVVNNLLEIEREVARIHVSSRKNKVAEIEKLEKDAEALRENVIVAGHCIKQWRQFIADYGIVFGKTEFIVYSKNLDYCGTVDGILYSEKLNNKTFINDYKTSDPRRIRNKFFQVVGTKPYPEHFVQMSGYDYAHHEETNFNPDGYMVVYLPKEGPYQVFTREQVEQDRKGWENLVRTYKWLQSLKGSKYV